MSAHFLPRKQYRRKRLFPINFHLFLSAGKLVDFFVQMRFQTQQFDHFFLCGNVRCIFQAVCDVLHDIEIGEQGIILKYDVEAAFFHGHVCNILAVKNDLTIENGQINVFSTVTPS